MYVFKNASASCGVDALLRLPPEASPGSNGILCRGRRGNWGLDGVEVQVHAKCFHVSLANLGQLRGIVVVLLRVAQVALLELADDDSVRHRVCALFVVQNDQANDR